MKSLKEILYRTRIENIIGSTDLSIGNISFDSRDVSKRSLFIATKGSIVDGHLFIEQAIKQGAIAVVCETLPEVLSDKVTYVKVKDSREALGWIASNFYDNPSN